MTDKYYRVLSDNFIWKKGAIIKSSHKNLDGTVNGYGPIEDIWDTTPVNNGEYISCRIIEHPDNAAFLERVYPDTITGRIFKTKDQLTQLYTNTFKQ